MPESNFIEHNHETEHTKEINMMQIRLVLEWDADITDENEKFEKWIELYSKRFREIIGEELDANESFWEDFVDHEFQEELLFKIKDKLYKDDNLNNIESLNIAA